VLTARGQWLRPIALGILDDHSRLCCHVQLYLSETAEDLVPDLSQAIQDSQSVSSLPQTDGALRPLERRPGRSGRCAERNPSDPHLSPRQKRQCRWSPLSDRARHKRRCG
jgi:hypothetical protein